MALKQQALTLSLNIHIQRFSECCRHSLQIYVNIIFHSNFQAVSHLDRRSKWDVLNTHLYFPQGNIEMMDRIGNLLPCDERQCQILLGLFGAATGAIYKHEAIIYLIPILKIRFVFYSFCTCSGCQYRDVAIHNGDIRTQTQCS